MPVFLERYVLPVLATFTVTVLIGNSLKWRRSLRIWLFAGVLVVAYVVAQKVYLNAKGTPPVSTAGPSISTPHITGNASTKGDNSPANTGDSNTFNLGTTAAPKQKGK